MRRMVTVSLQADARYKRAFAQVAADQGKDEGELVREALDAKFGSEINGWLSLFPKSEPQKVQAKLESAEVTRE